MIDMSGESRREFDTRLTNLTIAIDQYNIVARRFFSVASDAQPADLIYCARAVIKAHSKIYGPFTNEVLRIFEIGRRRLLAEIKRMQPIVSVAEALRKGENTVVNLIFVNNALMLASGLTIVFTRYFQYLGDSALPMLVLPQALDSFRRINRRSRWAAALSGVSLALTLVGFWPILSLPTGLFSIVWWVIETRYLAPKSLATLKEMAKAALVAEQEVADLRQRIAALRDVAAFVADFAVAWPPEAQILIATMAAKQPVDPLQVAATTAKLDAIMKELRSRQYVGIDPWPTEVASTPQVGGGSADA